MKPREGERAVPAKGRLSGALLAGAVRAARHAARQAYAPYSKFRVGVALVTCDGHVFEGCNVENASYGMTMCAERTAVGAAVAIGDRDFRAVVIYTPRSGFTMPCGACRQVLAEFNPGMEVILVNRPGRIRRYRLDALLPGAFVKSRPG